MSLSLLRLKAEDDGEMRGPGHGVRQCESRSSVRRRRQMLLKGGWRHARSTTWW